MKTIKALFLLFALVSGLAYGQVHDYVYGGVTANITSGYVSPAVSEPSLNFRNVLDNGAFNLYQRGTTAVTSIAATATYHADRWAAYSNNGSASVTLTNVTSGLLPGYGNAEKLQRAAANAQVTPVFLVQEISSVDVIPMQGQAVCLSASVLAGANFSAASSKITAQVITGTGTDQGLSSLIAATWTGQATTLNDSTQIVTTTWTRYAPSSWCFTMPVNATEAAVQIGFTPVGTAGADDSITLTGVQFEQVSIGAPLPTGITAQPSVFEQRPIAVELAKAQRYFWQITEANSFFAAQANCTATNTITISFPTPVQMRTTPTSAITVGGWQAVIAGAAAAGLSGQAAATSNVNSVNITATNACTAGNTVMIRGSGTTGKITATADF